MPSMPAPEDWTYVGPGQAMFGDVDVVRFHLQDTDPSVRLLADLDLQYLIDIWLPKADSLVYVAAIAAEVVAAKFAGVVSVTADGVAVNTADLSKRYQELAVQLRQRHKDYQVGAEIDIANLLWEQGSDYSIDPLEFGVSMHDNPAAGRQDYGSQRGHYSAFPEDSVGWL